MSVWKKAHKHCTLLNITKQLSVWFTNGMSQQAVNDAKVSLLLGLYEYLCHSHYYMELKC